MDPHRYRRESRDLENREWLWQRHYTALELRVFDVDRSFKAYPPEEELGVPGNDLLGAAGRAQLDSDRAHLFVS